MITPERAQELYKILTTTAMELCQDNKQDFAAVVVVAVTNQVTPDDEKRRALVTMGLNVDTDRHPLYLDMAIDALTKAKTLEPKEI